MHPVFRHGRAELTSGTRVTNGRESVGEPDWGLIRGLEGVSIF
jgi:hypothetical protein